MLHNGRDYMLSTVWYTPSQSGRNPSCGHRRSLTDMLKKIITSVSSSPDHTSTDFTYVHAHMYVLIDLGNAGIKTEYNDITGKM